jgi:hypothetical protein
MGKNNADVEDKEKINSAQLFFPPRRHPAKVSGNWMNTHTFLLKFECFDLLQNIRFFNLILWVSEISSHVKKFNAHGSKIDDFRIT